MTPDEPTARDEPIEIDRGDVVWRFDPDFLRSNWTCIFGRGCQGILDRPTPELSQGCCSLGAHFGDGDAGRDEAMHISAMAAALEPTQWQYHGAESIFGDDDRTCTAVVDGACVFLNRVDFARGAGCALHLGALDSDEAITDWKPSVCWQLPLHVDWALLDSADPDGPETATVRRWSRADWGDHGTTMAWVCTEEPDAYVGEREVIDSMATELDSIASPEVIVELRARLDHR